VVQGHKDWRDYLLNREYSMPYQGHNGGIWPFVGGFYILALNKVGRQQEALDELYLLAQVNAQDDFSFPEVVHGQSGVSIGARHQAWSAGMFISAYKAVVR